MDYDEACFIHLTPGVVHNCPKAVGVWDFCPLYALKDPRVLFEFWSLVSTIDGSTLPQNCVEEQLYAEHEVTDKMYNNKNQKNGCLRCVVYVHTMRAFRACRLLFLCVYM